MKIVTVSRKYQVTIPKDIREKLGIKVGDKVIVRLEDKRIIIEPIVKEKDKPLKRLLSLIDKPLDIDAVKLVEESWNGD
ncbi:MAG: AbrB/MazE/SpoVT family DNA-binding domain-containing protein [Candidatus Njordarchaeales archaeon]